MTTIRVSSPRVLARRVTEGGLSTDTVYEFVSADDPHTVIAELDTTAPVGPVSGKATWVFDVHPHPWAQDVAEGVWESLDWSEVPDDAEEPYERNCVETGWSCRIFVRVAWS